MNTEALLFQLEHAPTNDDRWRVFFNTSNAYLKQHALTLLLMHTTSNHERWGVYTHATDTTFREHILILILTHATLENSLDDLWAVYECISEDLKEHVLSMIELVRVRSIRDAQANSGYSDTTTAEHEVDMISLINKPSTRDGERWDIFFNSKLPSIKFHAITAMMANLPQK